MEPACTIISHLGGEAAVAAIVGTSLTAPYRWQHAKEKGGTGGLIPQRHIPALMAAARAAGKPLDAAAFLPVEAQAASAPEAAA